MRNKGRQQADETRPEADFEPILTLEEMAAKLRLEPSQLYELTRKRCRNPLPFLKVGKWLRFRLSDVNAWMNRKEA